MLQEFRTFILRGNVLDLAVGIIIGAAFTAIVTSIVNDLINPFIGLILGGIDLTNIFIVLRDGATVPGPYVTLADAVAAGAVTVNIGNFLNAVIKFLIVAIVVFMIVKAANRAMALARLKSDVPEAPAAPDPVVVATQHLTESIERLNATMERRA